MEQQQSHEQAPAQSAAAQRRYVVAQATGILTARFGIDSDAAYDELAVMAAEEGRPVIDLAREMVAQLQH